MPPWQTGKRRSARVACEPYSPTRFAHLQAVAQMACTFLDKTSKQRLKVRSGVQQGSAPITAIAINSASTILAYAGYDWHKERA